MKVLVYQDKDAKIHINGDTVFFEGDIHPILDSEVGTVKGSLLKCFVEMKLKTVTLDWVKASLFNTSIIKMLLNILKWVWQEKVFDRVIIKARSDSTWQTILVSELQKLQVMSYVKFKFSLDVEWL